MPRKKRQKRGYLVALLIGFDEQEIHIWRVYSHSIREYKHVKLDRKWKNMDDKQIYHFNETLVNIIRPVIKEGLKSILLAELPKKECSDKFLEHVKKHHQWLIRSRGDNKVSFGQIVGSAGNFEEATFLINKHEFIEVLTETTSDEGDKIINQLEKSINSNDENVIITYGLKEIEGLIYKGGKQNKFSGDKGNYLLISREFLENHNQKNRINRLMQIAENKGVSIKIYSEETPAGNRVIQFGGILCFIKKE